MKLLNRKVCLLFKTKAKKKVETKNISKLKKLSPDKAAEKL